MKIIAEIEARITELNALIDVMNDTDDDQQYGEYVGERNALRWVLNK